MEISAPNVQTAEQALLTDAIASSAEERISGFEIVGSEEYGDDAMEVTAKITQDGVATTRSFHVERAGRTALVFPEWQMGETEYAYMSLQIPDGATSLLVNGQEVAVDSLAVEDGYAMAVVLPGQYTVGLPAGSDFLDIEESTVFVTADPNEWYELHAAPTYTLNDAGIADVQSQIDALIDECATSDAAEPGEAAPSARTPAAGWSRAPAPGPSTPTRSWSSRRITGATDGACPAMTARVRRRSRTSTRDGAMTTSPPTRRRRTASVSPAP